MSVVVSLNKEKKNISTVDTELGLSFPSHLFPSVETVQNQQNEYFNKIL